MKNFTKIVTVAYLFLSITVLEFNYVTQFDTCCIDRDKVTVKFVVRSDHISIYAFPRRTEVSDQWFRPVGLRFRPVALRFRPVGLRFRPVDLRFRPQGLRFRPVGLRFRPVVLGLRSSFLGLRFRHIQQNMAESKRKPVRKGGRYCVAGSTNGESCTICPCMGLRGCVHTSENPEDFIDMAIEIQE